jgi:hypothetical protein
MAETGEHPHSQEKRYFPDICREAVPIRRTQSLSSTSTLVCDDDGEAGSSDPARDSEARTNKTRRRKFPGTAARQQSETDAAAYRAERLAEREQRMRARAGQRKYLDRLADAQDTLAMQHQMFTRLAAAENKPVPRQLQRARKADLERRRIDAEDALVMSAGPQVLWGCLRQCD